jgi:hypothetical protein
MPCFYDRKKLQNFNVFLKKSEESLDFSGILWYN